MVGFRNRITIFSIDFRKKYLILQLCTLNLKSIFILQLLFLVLRYSFDLLISDIVSPSLGDRAEIDRKGNGDNIKEDMKKHQLTEHMSRYG